ncbi:aminotransferase class I/II-fold pyridoxal phosphate-dependent enzyme [Lederbergia citrea]|uniref:aminotransferase class I/II-fold pyridoxal phosphate-dependent enzyme n=1 Tax=Lederbergia citrea TaxID=2833581 RepID=UPI001BC9BBFE|nr:aminotransferase class I/II-fold pyridoxal phosphate-dependent enzyme [Lederbergia citrea]MBS4206392.1 aminotransferase class I/II-fold pyridoxal phosphate-dependent enzyme [Lederbergia citrea]
MEQKQMPLYERLAKHKANNPISFHVPGHKNGMLYNGFDSTFKEFMEFDVTELTGLDDLHDPNEAIAEAQQRLTKLYKTKKSYFLVNGSTVGNLAMILSTCNEGDIVLVQRNCHKSILNGLMLANVKPIFISPEIDKNLLIPTGVDAKRVREALDQYPNIKACIFTYPDYYGQTYELKKIIEMAHQDNILVLIDEAHGPHFQLGDPFPPSSLALGADMAVHSAHKMLPAMTMGSYLHINSERISLEKVEFYLSVLQSSSPSYPIMASLDVARSYLEHLSENDLAYTLRQKDAFIDKLKSIPGLNVIGVHDPIKLLLRHDYLSGYELQTILEGIGIFPELADPYQVLLILPLLKEKKEYPFEQTIERMKQFSWNTIRSSTKIKKVNHLDKEENKIIELSFSYKEMLNMAYEWVKFEVALGRIAAKMVIPYPPGIPLLLPGEKITAEHITRLRQLLQAGARFQGGTEEIKAEKIAVFIK